MAVMASRDQINEEERHSSIQTKRRYAHRKLMAWIENWWAEKNDNNKMHFKVSFSLQANADELSSAVDQTKWNSSKRRI